MNKYCALVLPVGALLSGCNAQTFSGEGQVESSIIGGAVDRGDPGVVALFAHEPGSGQGFLCTAEVISPTVLLTAAHCVSEEETGPGVVFDVITGSDLDQATTTLAVREVHHDPAFDSNHPENGHDVGVAILAQPIGVTPLPFIRQPLTRDLIGKNVRLVGYGVSNGRAGTGSGVKRQTTTVLNGFDDLVLDIGTRQRGTCNGDSGGPAFMNIDGVETIVGVTSYGDLGCTSSSYDTRVDQYVAFIDGFLDGGSGGPNPPPPPPPAVGTCDENGGLETESNDAALDANDLCSDGTIGGSLQSAGDVDWFAWSIAADADYFVTLQEPSDRTTMRLYKAVNGSLERIADGEGGGGSSSLSRHTSTGGDYYLRVAGTGASLGAGSRYRVSVEVR